MLYACGLQAIWCRKRRIFPLTGVPVPRATIGGQSWRSAGRTNPGRRTSGSAGRATGPSSDSPPPVSSRNGPGTMDLGIRGRNAIVCAASKGLGRACAVSLAREGVNITMIARTKDALEAAAKEIREATGVRVTAVAGDVTTEAGRTALLAACPQPDIL